ncbi:esterase/lipase family protein [Martelella radicis]|uniref:Pimeloyl-ACP methyl ester carboxylesterase n=1 Tax=Martelella radicis TaxID=1397476 RepID=A0A7W6KI36_9HYPH|nr:alpha/beta hydrolase [Martelella radicis]MBB4121543.1 pimeloyl-ACP methyl ester carboxylesterase [Martelella radicis]
MAYGMEEVQRHPHSRQAVVVLHGIRQTRDDIRDPFALEIARLSPDTNVFVFGYDHTQHLHNNGLDLANVLNQGSANFDPSAFDEINLVGYSMGGLIARLAASDRFNAKLRTVITIATPNKGALGFAHVGAQGYAILKTFHVISPLSPRSAGIRDLTIASEIMYNRRKYIRSQLQQNSMADNPVENIRYASVPALFYHRNRDPGQLGPSAVLTILQQTFRLANLVGKAMDNMNKPHDGIVTEDSCDVTREDADSISELQLAPNASNGCPARMHVFHEDHLEQDHSSIVQQQGFQYTAKLVKTLLETQNWSDLSGANYALAEGITPKFPH